MKNHSEAWTPRSIERTNTNKQKKQFNAKFAMLRISLWPILLLSRSSGSTVLSRLPPNMNEKWNKQKNRMESPSELAVNWLNSTGILFSIFFSFRQFHFRHDRSCFMRARAIERLMREENDVEINFTSTILWRTHIAHPTDRLFVLTWSTCLGLSPLFRWWTNAWNGKSPNHSENEILIRLKLKF